MTLTLRFLGGTGTVTGSKFLLRDGDLSVLVDAGLFQGLRELRRRNWEPFPLDPEDIGAAVLTHAHLDHCGYLPALVRQGMRARVHATASTIALAEIVLRDSAKLQEEDAEYAARKGFSKHARPAALYTVTDVERLLPLFRAEPFGTEVALAEGASLVLRPAGHILGSSTAEVRIGDDNVFFSGDLGRSAHPLLVDPAPPPAADAFVVESTYGDRHHEPGAAERLATVITRTIGRGGVVLVPAFAVDRTEVLLLTLRELMESGAIPRVPVFIDSPMALSGLAVYRAAVAERRADVQDDADADPTLFDPGDLREIRSAAESMKINDPGFPCIVVSSSGMATGGRVVHHLRHLLPEPRNTVVLVGYQAAGTRGRNLAEGARTLKMHGRYVPVRAEVVAVDGFSVHADADEMLAWLVQAPQPPETLYVVHGEPAASEALASRIHAELGWNAVVPKDGEVVRVG